MKKLLATTAVVLAVASPALAETSLWVLIGVDGHMGPTITYRDTARDADINIGGEGLPTFTTLAACQAALQHAIRKHAGKSHAEMKCVDYFAMAKGQ